MSFNVLTLSGPAFSAVRQARGGGGGGLRGPDVKNQCKHQPIEMKLCMSHYIPKSIPDAKGLVKLMQRVKNSSFIFTVCVRSVPRYQFKLAYVILQMAVKEFFETHF